MENKLTAAIIDTCAVFRSGLKTTFRNHNRIRVEEGDSFKDFTRLVLVKQLAVVFLDVEFYIAEKPAVLQAMHQKPDMKMVIIYSDNYKTSIGDLLNEPVQSFIYKNASPSEFIKAFEHTIENSVYYCNETIKIISTFLHRPEKVPVVKVKPESFTEKEKEIIELICKELTAKEIANKLSLSKRTVENRKIRILEKMNVKNMAGIVAFAYQHNLVKATKSILLLVFYTPLVM